MNVKSGFLGIVALALFLVPSQWLWAGTFPAAPADDLTLSLGKFKISVDVPGRADFSTEPEV